MTCSKSHSFSIYISYTIFPNRDSHELTKLLRELGAKSVTWSDHPSLNVTYPCPDAMAPRLSHASNYKFLGEIPEWQNVVQSRLDEKCDSITMRFIYDNDFHVNDDLVEKALGKMNIDRAEKKLLFAEHVARESLTESGHDRLLLSHSIVTAKHPDHHLGLFDPVRIAVSVEFFSYLEYWEFNRKWIASNWSTLHVQSFLRLIDLSKYEKSFYDEEIDGEILMSVINNPAETLTAQLKMSAADISVLKDRVRRLGLPDELGILLAVEKEECRVRAEHEKALERMVHAANSKSPSKGAKPTGGEVKETALVERNRETAKQSQPSPANGKKKEGPTFTEGVYEVVMVVSAFCDVLCLCHIRCVMCVMCNTGRWGSG